MKPGKIITEDDEIKSRLENAKTIAIVGLSPKPERDSNKVGKYLKNQGYRIIPVRPGQKEILGKRPMPHWMISRKKWILWTYSEIPHRLCPMPVKPSACRRRCSGCS